MAKTQAEYQREYRARKKLTRNTNAPDTNAPDTNAPVTALPPLPDDDVIACNETIGWDDVLAMTKSQVDYVYRAWQAVGDNVLLRMRRAAGYWRRRDLNSLLYDVPVVLHDTYCGDLDGDDLRTVPGDPGYEGKLVGYAGSERARVEAILERESSEACQVG